MLNSKNLVVITLKSRLKFNCSYPLSAAGEERVNERSDVRVSRCVVHAADSYREALMSAGSTHPGFASLADPLFRFAGKRVKHLVCNLAAKTSLSAISLVFILIFLPLCSFSQELRLVKETPNKFFVEQYYVLNAKPEIKQGLYQKYLASTLTLVQQGYFKDNKRDSVWKSYDSKGKVIELGGYSSGTKNGHWKSIIYNGDTAVVVREGNWRDGNMVDLWTFRNADGSLDYKCDFTNKSIVEYGANEEPSTFIDNKDTLSATLDKPAIHLGGTDTLLRLLSKNIRTPLTYPGRGGLKEVPGNFKVLLSFTVNESGKLEDYKVIRGSKKEYNDEALRALKLCDDGNWVPAIYKGHPVKVIEIIPISFDVSIRNDGPTALSGFL